jgi:hypothetical protein
LERRERSERKIYEIEQVFELQKAKFSSYPENPTFGGISGFSVPIWGTGGIDSKRGTIPPDWGRMASLTKAGADENNKSCLGRRRAYLFSI